MPCQLPNNILSGISACALILRILSYLGVTRGWKPRYMAVVNVKHLKDAMLCAGKLLHVPLFLHE